MYANERRVRFTEMEYAIPRERAAEAVERVLALIERRRLPVGVPDRAARGGARRRLPVHRPRSPHAYIAVHQYRGMEFETYFRAVERIMDEYGGPPALGQAPLPVGPHPRAALSRLGALPVGAPAFDPEGRFANDYTDRVLGPLTA